MTNELRYFRSIYFAAYSNWPTDLVQPSRPDLRFLEDSDRKILNEILLLSFFGVKVSQL